MGDLTFIFDKKCTDLLCFTFQFGRLGALFRGAKPTKAPRGDGTDIISQIMAVNRVSAHSLHNLQCNQRCIRLIHKLQVFL